MTPLILGLALFFAPHLLRELCLRDRLVAALPSENAYKGIYSLVSLLGLGLMVWGKANSPFIMIWEPVFELRYISHVLMIPAVILVTAGNTPLSYMRKELRNPMVLGVSLWGIAHLWANGDLASILLFGSFALWGLIKFVTLGFIKGQSTQAANIFWDIFAFLAGLIVYVVISIYHGPLFGVGLSFV